MTPTRITTSLLALGLAILPGSLGWRMLRATSDYDRAVAISEQVIEEAQRTGLDFVVDHAQIELATALIGKRSLGRAGEVIRDLDRRSDQLTHHVRVNAELKRFPVTFNQEGLATDESGIQKTPPFVTA